jgi:hypothetical protein
MQALGCLTTRRGPYVRELLRAVIKPAVTPRRFPGRLGRRPKLSAHQKRKALARREAGEPLTEIARSYIQRNEVAGSPYEA